MPLLPSIACSHAHRDNHYAANICSTFDEGGDDIRSTDRTTAVVKELIKDNLNGLDSKAMNTHDNWWETAQNWHNARTLRSGDGKILSAKNDATDERYSHLDDSPLSVRAQRHHNGACKDIDSGDKATQLAIDDRIMWFGEDHNRHVAQAAGARRSLHGWSSDRHAGHDLERRGTQNKERRQPDRVERQDAGGPAEVGR